MNRRRFLQAATSAALPWLMGCGTHRHGRGPKCPGPAPDFELADFPNKTVFRMLPKNGAPKSSRAVVVLHELPGLTPDDLALARCIADAGFAVYVPLLFGEKGQDNFARGFLQSCLKGEFECSDRSKRSPVLDWLEPLCDRAQELSGRPVAVVGMCLTGILPLALLRPSVAAAVVCQPTLPFNALLRRPTGEQKKDLGLSTDDLRRAVDAKVPFLAMRYQSDPLCPTERMETLRDTFKDRVATIEVALPEDGHSVLASSFNKDAFDDAMDYLRVRLNVDAQPKPMRLARLGQRRSRCEITSEGTWRAI